MAAEWSLDFCLVCDRQTQGGPYCSQSCRLAELDLGPEDPKVSSMFSRGGSDNGKGRVPSHMNHTSQALVSSSYEQDSRFLSSSSSQTSLSSLKSNSSKVSTLPGQFQSELRDYASCFDPVRDLKRRLTT
ncbi:hypothetical protein FE257_010143 [Aspergillus nanangensis]|uniref:Uncharacterized protein n=1 Tax=Aspergillus nanangensis TaxID=2582783 RepID=A0AAD4GSC1_ASPNN|nr:hypothetical protein FE257_010143 [Aspergillus nanangensis]